MKPSQQLDHVCR